jgi:LysM repeat protein
MLYVGILRLRCCQGTTLVTRERSRVKQAVSSLIRITLIPALVMVALPATPATVSAAPPTVALSTSGAPSPTARTAAGSHLLSEPILPAYILYVARAGDTAPSIAQRFNDASWLLSKRNGGLDRIAPGQRITVLAWPFDRAYTAVEDIRTDKPQTYVVAPGDSLWGISVSLNTTMHKLLSDNGLTIHSVIVPGMRLLLHHYTDHWRRVSIPFVASAGIHTGLLLTDVANMVGVDAALFKAMVWKESRWKMMTGRSGEIGMVQIMPATARWIERTLVGFPLDPRVPINNALLGALLVKHYMNVTRNNMAKALALYHSSNVLLSKRNRTYIQEVLHYRDYFYHHPRAGF